MRNFSPASVVSISSMSNDDAVKYGYGDGTPDVQRYGYGDGAPDVSEYGYGDGAPDVAKSGNSISAPDTGRYGYGGAAPDVAKYGYGDSQPQYFNPGPNADKYGYGNGGPDAGKYSYGEASSSVANGRDGQKEVVPQARARRERRMSAPRAPRRSSLKPAGTPRLRRRASIQCTGEIEVQLPGQDKPTKRRTSISFDETVRVKPVEPVSNLADKPQELWFQDDEYDRIRNKSLLLADRAISGRTGGKNFCFRGLEGLIERGQVLDRKSNAWDSVLDEQAYQRDKGQFDDEYMANLYKFQTVKSQQEATKRAKQDADEIANYLRQTRKNCRRLSM